MKREGAGVSLRWEPDQSPVRMVAEPSAAAADARSLIGVWETDVKASAVADAEWTRQSMTLLERAGGGKAQAVTASQFEKQYEDMSEDGLYTLTIRPFASSAAPGAAGSVHKGTLGAIEVSLPGGSRLEGSCSLERDLLIVFAEGRDAGDGAVVGQVAGGRITLFLDYGMPVVLRKKQR